MTVAPPSPIGPPAESVADLLAAAREAHKKKYHLAGQIDRAGKVVRAPHYAAAEAAIAEALRCREAAHAQDPGHVDPAWRADEAEMRVSHDALVAFYRHYPSIP